MTAGSLAVARLGGRAAAAPAGAAIIWSTDGRGSPVAAYIRTIGTPAFAPSATGSSRVPATSSRAPEAASTVATCDDE